MLLTRALIFKSGNRYNAAHSNRIGKSLKMTTQPSKSLETFPNPQPGRDYHIHMEIPEFTCLCPKTGQPDFATLTLDYIPDGKCVELKSLKLYIWSFRNEGHFHEDVTNRILDDLVAALQPRFMRLTAQFYVRGGIFTSVVAEHRKPGWQPEPPVELNRFAAQSNIK
jgi:7-cyano-7-deazaguanine reductase